MKIVLHICRRDLGSLFDSLTGYIILVLFLGLSGFFTWLFGQDIFFVEQASLDVFFEVAYWTIFFFVPALTMQMLAEEKKSGTFELLITKAIEDWQIVAGKFLASWFVLLFALILTIPYYVTVAWLGPVDHGGTIGGYVSLLLIGAAYCSIGIFSSSLTQNQIVAYLIALFLAAFFHIIFYVLHSQLTGYMADMFYFLSFETHYNSMSRGVFDSRALVYILTIIAAGLFFAGEVLNSRNRSV